MLLNIFIFLTSSDQIDSLLDTAPGALDRQGVVERKLLVYHYYGMIGPHVVEAELRQLADALVNIAVAHMAVGQNE